MSRTTGKEFRDTVATYLSSLVDKRDYAGAVEFYEAHRSVIGETGGSWAGGLLLKVSKACASLSDYPTALKTARIAQAMTSREGDTVLLAEIFIVLGGILRDMGQMKEARKAFQDAESIFRRNDDLEGQSRALNFLAGLMFRQADYSQALQVLMDAVEIARKLDDKKKLAFMMGNIGRIYTFTGDISEAEKYIRINIDLSRELGDDLETARAYLSLSYIYIERSDYQMAEQTLDDAYPFILRSSSRRDEAIYLSYRGELQYRQGQFQDAQQSLEKALTLAEDIAPRTTLTGRILRHMAEFYVRTDNFRLAQKLSARSMVIMEDASNKVEIGALLKIRAQIAEAKGEKATSVKLFQQAIDQLDESGVRIEKAEALVAAGRSRLFTGRQRMTYLFRAEEYYSRSGMKRKLNEVNRLISDLSSLTLDATSTCNHEITDTSKGADYLTTSPEIQRFKAQLPMLGRSDLPILLTGDTGVGKDHMARYFHSLVRPSGPYVTINCASVPETLLESELFGYSRGAFTGADGDKKGIFVTACGGVLLLDEIGDMPLSLQAKLLGVLERRKVVPLGSTKEVDLDILVVAATNKDLEAMVEAGTFRRDLYYRLSGVTFRIPSLRERKGDITLLLKKLMTDYGLLAKGEEPSAELKNQFVVHDWPGNIRELDIKVKRLQIMSQMVVEGDLVELCRSLFGGDTKAPTDLCATDGSLFDRVERFERKLITEALLAAQGNKSEAARMLGVHEATVRTKLKRYGISMMSLESEGGAPN